MTPKFNKIAISFMQKINDPITETLGVISAGQIIRTKADIENYVNKAMLELFNNIWIEAKGNVNTVISILPEFRAIANVSVTAGQIALTSIQNYKMCLPSYLGTTYIAVWDQAKLPEIVTSKDPFNTPVAGSPVLVNAGTVIYYFPSATTTITLNYLRLPLNADGTRFTSGQALDIPFSEDWIEKISKEAERLYKIDANENTGE